MKALEAMGFKHNLSYVTGPIAKMEFERKLPSAQLVRDPVAPFKKGILKAKALFAERAKLDSKEVKPVLTRFDIGGVQHLRLEVSFPNPKKKQ